MKKELYVMYALFIILIASLVSAEGALVKVIAPSEEVGQQFIATIAQSPEILYFKLGNAFGKKGDWASAELAYKKAIVSSLHFKEAYHNLGTAYHEEGNNDEAIAAFTTAISIDPGYAKAHYSLALAYFEKGMLAEAVNHITIAANLDQTNPGAQFDAGIMSVDLFQQGQENGEIRSDLLFGAKIFFERCLEDDPLFPHAKDNLNITNKVAEYYN